MNNLSTSFLQGDSFMNNGEKEYQRFMSELMNKASEINEKYQNLSNDNKSRVQASIKPIIDAGLFAWLFDNHQ